MIIVADSSCEEVIAEEQSQEVLLEMGLGDLAALTDGLIDL